VTQLQLTVDGLEKERDFYFSKLRDVEVLVQSRLDSESADGSSPIARLCAEIQAILYSTEEGFEVPDAQQEIAQENQVPVNGDDDTY
jgi:microtubule-associated protein, RP/EB family